MSRIEIRGVAGKWSTALFSLFVMVFCAQSGGHAHATDALKYFKNYFVTGDYVVGGVGLQGLGVSGLASGNIQVSGVPANADVVAAFLYWQEVSNTTLGSDAGLNTATFKGNPLVNTAGPITGPIAKVLAPDGTAACSSATGLSGSQYRTYTYRADVLRFLQLDVNGRFIANGSHAIQLPDAGPGATTVPIALGASLVIVYRDPTLPMRAIVIDDGGYTMDAAGTMSQTVKGFYQNAQGSTRLTHIVGSGQPGLSERLVVAGAPPTLNAFASTAGRSWDNPTVALTLPAGVTSLTTSVDHLGGGSDCLTWGAVVLSTPVRDSDGDGLLDIWESSAATILDPNGDPLPNLRAMGASPTHKDLFVQIDYMQTTSTLTYGSGAAAKDKPAHSHLPTPTSLKMVAEAFRDAPVSNPDSVNGINVHFDVGNHYQPNQTDHPAEGSAIDPFIIRANLAHGGRAFDETMTTTGCVRGPNDPPWVCQFSDYPGTVGWKSGFRFIKDMPVNAALTDDQCEALEQDGNPSTICGRVFDRTRKDSFRYALFAHSLGAPKATCLQADGFPDSDCEDTNPLYHVPVTNTGVGDFPGGDVLVTLGAFDDISGNPVGTPFMQASTLMHEWGHNLELRHGGGIAEPNCKPNYLSVMNYLFQLRGLLDDAGKPHLGYSANQFAPLDEFALADGYFPAFPFRTGWYAPQGPGTVGSPATRHCDGSDLLKDAGGNPTEPVMVRVDAPTVLGLVDWNMDGVQNSGGATSSGAQDINFDGSVTSLDQSSNDWSAIRLDQLGGRRNVGGWFFVPDTANPGGFVAYIGPFSLDVGRGDLGRGDLGRGDLGRGDLGRGDLGRGDLGRGDLGRGDLGRGDLGRGDLGRGDLGRGDLGRGDLGRGDLGIGTPDEPPGDLDLETAQGGGNTPPVEFTAAVRGLANNCAGLTAAECHRIQLGWKPPNVGTVVTYFVYRIRTDDPAQVKTLVGSVPAQSGQATYSLVDSEELPNGITFTYFAIAEFNDATATTADTVSGPSNNAMVTAVNDPPVATPQTVTTTENIPSAPIVFAATDDDSAPSALTFTVASNPGHGTLNGAPPIYAPAPNYNGADSFTFQAHQHVNWSGDPTVPMSLDSLPGTVSIAVSPVNTQPTAASQLVATNEDTPAIITLSGNDLETLPANLISAITQAPAHGTLSASGLVRTYTPAANYHGPDSFKFTLTDRGDPDGCAGGPPACAAALTSVEATVSITVAIVNDQPTAASQLVAVNEDTPTSITLAGNDVETALANLTFTVIVPPAHGGLSATTVPGSAPMVTYTPAANYNGPDSFTFTVTDRGDPDACGIPGPACTAAAASNPATVSITVKPVNDVPVAVKYLLKTNEETPLVITLPGSDVETAPANLKFSIVTGPRAGTLSGTAPNIIYTPNPNYNGADSFFYRVTDRGDPDGCTGAAPACQPALSSASTEVSLTVVAVNDKPAAVPRSVSAAVATPLTITLAGSDVETCELQFTIVTAPAHGTLGAVKSVACVAKTAGSLNTDSATIVYTPAGGYTGPDSFTYRVRDGADKTSPALFSDPVTVTISVGGGL